MASLLCAVTLIMLADAQDLVVYGPSMTQPLFEDLQIAFSLGHKNSVVYQSLNGQDLPNLLNSDNPVILNSITSDLPHSSLFPLFGYPLVLVFNLESTKLVLSQQALVDIFLGRITRWDDGNLTVLNPDVDLPSQPITLVIGSLLHLFTEGISVLAGEAVNNTYVVNNSINVERDVCSRVAITPFSLGFSWMADALQSGSKLALLENKEGFFADPVNGVSHALSEFHAALVSGDNRTVFPHNMPGRLSWPLIGLISIVLPDKFTSCAKLEVAKQFLTLLLFQEETDRLVGVLGWQPAGALQALDNSLGSLSDKLDYEAQLDEIICGSTQAPEKFHTIVTSPQLWDFVLKLLVAYAVVDPFLKISPSSENITTLLDNMVLGEEASLDIDVSFTWAPVAARPDLYAVPSFMGAIVPLVNLGNISVILSVPILAQIFTGDLVRWNDTRLQALNPGTILPDHEIIVFASSATQPDGSSMLLDYLLTSANLSTPFSWALVNTTAISEVDIVHQVQFTPFSIGYAFAHNLQQGVAFVAPMTGASDKPITLSRNSLKACWTAHDHPDCWPLAVPLAVVLRHPIRGITCKHQKLSVDFAKWIINQDLALDQFLEPTLPGQSLGEAEYCAGRSLLYTRPEPQVLSSAMTVVQVLCVLGMLWSTCQSIALGVARNHSDLKSASVLFSLLAVVGVFMVLITPLLIVQNQPTAAGCGASVWLLCLGFSLTYGSLFAKLFRLYKIFTSRSLVVPRLSNRKLFLIVMVFLGIDFVLLLIHTIGTSQEPSVFSQLILSEADLVTGYQNFTWTMCAFQNSWALEILVTIKVLVAFAGAGMAFFIRQVDRRFSATSALGGCFYNMFLTLTIAVLLMVFFNGGNVTRALFVPVFAGLWITYITLIALTVDSNVLSACRNISRPLRRLLKLKDSREPKKGSKGSKGSDDIDPDHKRSHTSATFVVNRDMFPQNYEHFDAALLEKILEELNFQRTAVRRAFVGTTTTQTAPTIQLVDLGRQMDSSAKFSKSPSGSGSTIPADDILPSAPQALQVSIDSPSASIEPSN